MDICSFLSLWRRNASKYLKVSVMGKNEVNVYKVYKSNI